jgi:hypothetical protein
VDPKDAIVEIGSYCGRSTSALALGASCRPHAVYAVDPHTGCRSQVEAGLTVDTFETFIGNMRRLGLADAVIPVRARSHEAACEYNGPPIGFLFVDGWHSADAVIDDVTSWMPRAARNVIVVFDEFARPDIAAGIAEVTHLLPQRLGFVGKDLVFGPDSVTKKLPRVNALFRAKIGANLSAGQI